MARWLEELAPCDFRIKNWAGACLANADAPVLLLAAINAKKGKPGKKSSAQMRSRTLCRVEASQHATLIGWSRVERAARETPDRVVDVAG